MNTKEKFPPDDLTVFMKQYPTQQDYTDEIWAKIAQKEIEMRKNNNIHATAMIGEFVELGEGNVIGANALITGSTKIGNNNRISPYAVIGTRPEHKGFWDQPTNKGVIIGDDCVIREFTTINAGCENPTVLEDQVIMLRGSHVGHDSKIMKGATLSCNVLVGGHSLVGYFVNMGLGAVCHQYSRIPHYCMIGMNATITKKFNDISGVFRKYVGSPVKSIGTNNVFLNMFRHKDMLRIQEEFNSETLGHEKLEK